MEIGPKKVEIIRRVKALLKNNRWLASRLKYPNDILDSLCLVVIEYWRIYEGVQVVTPSPGYIPTNPLLIISALGEVRYAEA